MLKDITLGQYYPADSAVHKLDPRVKLVATVVFIISLFVFRSISSYLTATLFLAGVIRLSKVPFRYMVKGLKTIFILMLITVAFNLFLTDGTPVLQIWKLTITLEGIRTAAFMAIRLVYLIIGSSVMTLTTTPNDLTDGMEKGLRFLKKIHVPVHEIAMIMSIALRFIPILMEEADKIMKAQMARGADFESGNIVRRVKSLMPLFIPLFVGAFRIAQDLAMAMEARCYRGGSGRTRLHTMKLEKRDGAAILLLSAYAAVILAERVLSGMFF